jgi:1-acyl-sn-glycerol-3-phosphate acyltransferase
MRPPPPSPTDAPIEPPEPYDPFDPAFSRAMIEDVLAPALDHYFRPVIVGLEHLPAPDTGPVVLAANHSGNAFPYDAIIFDAALWRLDGCDPAKKLRAVYEKELSYVWWMRPFGIDNFWRRGGGVDMLFDNFDRLLTRGDRILYFPEGVPGIGKGFNNRYRLQRYSTSFVLLAARHRAPVIPLYMINAEWINPFGYVFPPLDRLMQRVFGVPFLPLPAGLVGIVFPWIWYLAFPARTIFVFGPPMDMADYLAQAGMTDLDAPDRATLQRTAERVRQEMQSTLDSLAGIHGIRPYDAGHFWSGLRHAWGKLRWVLPTGWPVAYSRRARDDHRPPARNALHRILRDWDLVGFYLPFGWAFLSLTRMLRRPPCGYRGMTREAKAERQGGFMWRLSDRPLPPRAATPPA